MVKRKVLWLVGSVEERQNRGILIVTHIHTHTHAMVKRTHTHTHTHTHAMVKRTHTYTHTLMPW